jgi:hypothetical protein
MRILNIKKDYYCPTFNPVSFKGRNNEFVLKAKIMLNIVRVTGAVDATIKDRQVKLTIY